MGAHRCPEQGTSSTPVVLGFDSLTMDAPEAWGVACVLLFVIFVIFVIFVPIYAVARRC